MSLTDLRKFSTTIIKDKSATDQAQIPATVDIDVYKRGATVSAATIITASGGTATILVYDIGSLLVNSTCKVGTVTTWNLTVTAIASDTSITVRNDGSEDVAVSVGSRLVMTSDRPTLWPESTATAAGITGGHTTTDARGYVEFYVAEQRFDYIATSGSNAVLYTDQEAGADDPAWVNVLNYATFQAAIDALPDRGGTVYIPAGLYDRTTTPQLVPMTITKTIHLMGDNATRDTNTVGSKLVYKNYGTEDLTSNLITITGDTANYSLIENLYIEGPNSSGTGCGLVLGTVSYGQVRNCEFQTWPSYAVTGVPGFNKDIVNWSFDNCRFVGSKSNALAGLGMAGTAFWFATDFHNCTFFAGIARCVFIGGSSGTKFQGCTFEGNSDDASANGDTGAFIYVEGPTGNGNNKLRIDNCWFESTFASNTPNNWFIYLKGPVANCHVVGSYFSRGNASGPNSSLRAIKIEDTTGSGAFHFYVANNLGDFGGHTSVGTDDIVIPSTDGTRLTFMNNSIRDAGAFNKEWTISGKDEHNTTYLFGTRIKTTAGKPTVSQWLAGQTIYNTNDHTLYVCDVAGGPGTWYKVALVTA